VTYRVLVSRTDRLGDVALTLPLCGLLKARRDTRVIFLARPYARDVLAASDAVDEIVVWDDDLSPDAARRRIAAARADAIVHVRPNASVAWAARAAGVPVRIGTSRRLSHWLTCNRREPLSRRTSSLHEAQLNVRVARSLLDERALALAPADLGDYGALTPRAPIPPALRPHFAPDRFTLVIHPGSGGSATEWPLERYAALVRSLPASRFRILVTGSTAEATMLRPWLAAQPPHVHDVTGRTDVAGLIALLTAADGVVAASTGPLHLAAAVGTRTLGLYSPRRPIHPGRWAPIGPRAEVLVADVARDARGHEVGQPRDDAASIPVARVLARVEQWAAEARAERSIRVTPPANVLGMSGHVGTAPAPPAHHGDGGAWHG